MSFVVLACNVQHFMWQVDMYILWCCTLGFMICSVFGIVCYTHQTSHRRRKQNDKSFLPIYIAWSACSQPGGHRAVSSSIRHILLVPKFARVADWCTKYIAVITKERRMHFLPAMVLLTSLKSPAVAGS